MANYVDDLLVWLKENGIETCKGLRLDDEFIKFLGGIFASKTQEEIYQQIRTCCVAFTNDLDSFCKCVVTGLSS